MALEHVVGFQNPCRAAYVVFRTALNAFLTLGSCLYYYFTIQTNNVRGYLTGTSAVTKSLVPDQCMTFCRCIDFIIQKIIHSGYTLLTCIRINTFGLTTSACVHKPDGRIFVVFTVPNLAENMASRRPDERFRPVRMC